MMNKVFKKSLVIVVIVWFIGIAFIPNFNAVSISKDIEETNPIVDDIEEDCDCQSNAKTDLTEKILNKLENNKLFTDVINSDNSTFDRPLCELLYNWALYFSELGFYYLYSGHYFIGRIYLGISLYIYSVGVFLLCWPFIP